MEPKMYCIVVAGRLSPGFADGFDGVTQRDEGPDTVLEGVFIDQSHLHGLLDQLRRLGLEVTKFDTVSTDESQKPDSDCRGVGSSGALMADDRRRLGSGRCDEFVQCSGNSEVLAPSS